MDPETAYQLAYDAIEAYVAQNHSADRDAWQEITPTGDEWGYTVDGWEGAATDIVGRFNDRLPGGLHADVPPEAKRKSAKKPLIEFQRYLALKVGSDHRFVLDMER
jgi:hypothetical protein